MDYSYFDKIICLNLKENKKRYLSSLNEFKKLNINNVEYYFADKSKKGGRYGCFESHINIIKKCYNENYNNVLIFEDDFRISPYYNNDLLKECIHFIKKYNYDCFFFGYIPFTKNITEQILFSINKSYNNIIQFNPCGTHAFCINKNTMKKILNTYKSYIDNDHYDIYLSNTNIFKNYCITPMLFDQYWCYGTDNSIHSIDEYIWRKIQCPVGEKINFFPNVSYIVNIIINYKSLILFIIIFIILYLLLKKYKI